MPAEPLALHAADGRVLGGAWTPPVGRPRATVVICGANGVPHRFYAGTADGLAARGAGVLRFDYRGLGASRAGSPRREAASMRDWGALDVAAAIEAAAARAPGLPLRLLGHSAGGWLPGLAPNAGRLDAIVTVASQSGYWRLWPWPERAFLASFWFALLPLAVALFGYLPSFVLGGGEPLPPRVAREWARWGRHPRFLQRDDGPGFAAFRGGLRAYAVAGDDLYAPRAAVERFATFYGAAARVEVRDFAHRDARGRRPRHFTVFGAGFRERLLAEVGELLLADG